jgi:SAM-dependent methyltransferase
MSPDLSWPWPMEDTRILLARHLFGRGVELGPGHHPFPVPKGVTVDYVDKWQPDDNREMFPELGEAASFPEPNIVCDFDTGRLASIADETQDFVIVSHVLEHLAEPMGLLVDIHRVLRPGAVLLILLPDRTRTFDSERDPTPLTHILEEYEAGVNVVSDDHMIDFLTKAGEGANFTGLPAGGPEERARFFDWHRQRTIHVHCWQEDEFAELLDHAIGVLGLQFEFVDGLVAEDELGGIEFGYVLRRSQHPPDNRELAARFAEEYGRWLELRRALHARLRQQAETIARLEVSLDRYERVVGQLRRSPAYPVYRFAKGIRRRLRTKSG